MGFTKILIKLGRFVSWIGMLGCFGGLTAFLTIRSSVRTPEELMGMKIKLFIGLLIFAGINFGVRLLEKSTKNSTS